MDKLSGTQNSHVSSAELACAVLLENDAGSCVATSCERHEFVILDRSMTPREAFFAGTAALAESTSLVPQSSVGGFHSAWFLPRTPLPQHTSG